MVHSLAAWKAERYLFSVMPMFFAIVGMGVAEGARRVRPAFEGAVDWLAGASLGPRARALAVAMLFTLVALFAALGNGATSYALKMMRVSDADWQLALLYRGQPDWEAANAVLAPQVDSSAVRRLDIRAQVALLSASRGCAPERGLSRRSAASGPGVHALSQARAPGGEHHAVARSAPRVLSPPGWCWRSTGSGARPWSVKSGVADYIETTLDPVHLAPSTRLLAYRWRTSDSGQRRGLREDSRNRPLMRCQSRRSGTADVEYRTVAQLDDAVVSWLGDLPRDIDIVAGVPRSGLLVANLLALHSQRAR